MVLSMTGFGRGKAKDDNRELTIELKTVNHRYLDISLRMPRLMNALEEEFRKKIREALSRGRVEVSVSYKDIAKNQINVTVNEPVADAYHNAFKKLAEIFAIDSKPDLSVLSNISDIFSISEPEEDEEVIGKLLFSALEDALKVMLDMRKKEGEFLSKDIIGRCDIIKQLVDSIEERSPSVVEEYRKKLELRLKELLNNTELEESRFQTEIAYFADRSNITEEIIRLHSHLAQLKQTIKKGGSVGRKLDFIVQEMNREANTIGSKSSDITITNHVVEIKSEIEKIREQVQNIE
ncbi:MAG: YicC family protein [Clostridiales bacterium]|nr:YicC family protein [Clostridiales bacterium]